MKISEAAVQNITNGRIKSETFPLLLIGCIGDCLDPLVLISGRNQDNICHKSVSQEYSGDENCADFSLCMNRLSYLYTALQGG